MAKVFSLHKYIRRSRETDVSDRDIILSLLVWAIECQGKTAEEMLSVGFSTVDDGWMEEQDTEEYIRKDFQVSTGDLFYLDEEPYILAHTDDIVYCLISLINGNRWNDPVCLDDLDMSQNMFEKLFISDDDIEWYQVPREDVEIEITTIKR